MLSIQRYDTTKVKGCLYLKGVKNTVHHIAYKMRGSGPDAMLDCHLQKNQLLALARVCDQSSFKDFDTLAPSL